MNTSQLDGRLKKMRPRNVYLARCEQFHKIGVADRPIARFSVDQCPFEVRIVFEATVHNATKIEAALHRAYSGKRHRYSWYNLSEEDVHTIAQTVQQFASNAEREYKALLKLRKKLESDPSKQITPPPASSRTARAVPPPANTRGS